MIIDYKNAFMTVPLHPEEWPYNCSVAPQGVTRSRKPLDHGEPQTGSFVVWRVLGFGGKLNPLLYSRIATVAALRTGIGVLGHTRRHSTGIATVVCERPSGHLGRSAIGTGPIS